MACKLYKSIHKEYIEMKDLEPGQLAVIAGNTFSAHEGLIVTPVYYEKYRIFLTIGEGTGSIFDSPDNSLKVRILKPGELIEV